MLTYGEAMKYLVHFKNGKTGEIHSRFFEKQSFEQSTSVAYLVKSTLNEKCNHKAWRLVGLYEVQYNEKDIDYPKLEKEFLSKIQ